MFLKNHQAFEDSFADYTLALLNSSSISRNLALPPCSDSCLFYSTNDFTILPLAFIYFWNGSK